MEVRQADVLVHDLHSRFHQDMPEPGRALAGDMTDPAMIPRLVHSRRQPRVGSGLLGQADSCDIAEFRDHY